MGNWLNLYTLVAFFLGVLLAASVKRAASGLRSKAA